MRNNKMIGSVCSVETGSCNLLEDGLGKFGRTSAQSARVRWFVVTALSVFAFMLSQVQAGDFPRWRGENSGGSAGETTVPLVDSWNDVGIAWVSEVKTPHSWERVVNGKTHWPRTVLCNTGYSIPAIWDGKVYVTFWRPAGTNLAMNMDPIKQKWSPVTGPAMTLIEADEVIVCMDAKTGRTLWEAIWSGKEMNHVELYGGHNNICVANGKAYAIGNAGWAYCADAKTGAKIWDAPVGPSYKLWETYKQECILKRFKGDNPGGVVPLPPRPPDPLGGALYDKTYNICPIVADGVMITGDWSAGPRLVGLDGETGKELWGLPGVGGWITPPLLWRHENREYAILPSGPITCFDPKTGKTLWSGGSVGGGTTAALSGDFLVAPAAEQKGVPSDKQDGWVCYKLGTGGVEKVWALNASAYPGGAYETPTIHRGHVWLPIRCSKMVCVEIATGKVVSEVNGLNIIGVCPAPVTMADRMYYLGDRFLWMMDIDPKKPKFLGSSPQWVNYCTSCTAADGFVYFRSSERLVTCLDMRAPAKRDKAPDRHTDPANAFCRVTLPGAQSDGKDIVFCWRGRDGRVLQSWVETRGEGFVYPDILEAEGLKYNGDRVSGDVQAYLEANRYNFKLELEMAEDGAVKGRYADAYHGVSVTGTVSGELRAVASSTCSMDVTWPREWFDGQNRAHEHRMNVEFVDGKAKSVKFIPRASDAFTAAIEENKLAFDGARLSGSLIVNITRKEVIVPGRYTLNFVATNRNNLLEGSVESTRDGAKTTTHRAWGSIFVPETDPVKPDHAVFKFKLAKCVMGKTGITVTLSSDKGVFTDGTCVVENNSGLHKAAGSGLKIDGNRVTGDVKISFTGDGYCFRGSPTCVYKLDLAIDGVTVTGQYDGTYDFREPREGAITGVWYNDFDTAKR